MQSVAIIETDCPINVGAFPFDKQLCPMPFMSNVYPINQVMPLAENQSADSLSIAVSAQR
jgi:hypothetical protein